MESEQIAKLLANRDFQILQLSNQLNDHLNKIAQLSQTAEGLHKENLELRKKLDKKNALITQETNDVQILKNRISQLNAITWAESFTNLKSWIGKKIPNSIFKVPKNNK